MNNTFSLSIRAISGWMQDLLNNTISCILLPNIWPYQIPPSIQEGQTESYHANVFAIHSLLLLESPSAFQPLVTLAAARVNNIFVPHPGRGAQKKKVDRARKVSQLRKGLTSYYSKNQRPTASTLSPD